VWLSAAAFGIYHWFTFGVLGNPVAMIYVLLLTGAFGGMGAYAFARTKSVAAPIGLHLGWNLITYLVFSAGPAGAAILIPASGLARMKAMGFPGLLLSLVWPLAVIALVLFCLARPGKQPAGSPANSPA
jgi:membrane protease YdiL (CAAX protease family)